MQSGQVLQFHPYRLDPRTGQLWRGKQEVKLTPKVAAVLCYLVERAGQVVTKAELFQAVWKETVVSDAALSSCIQELRRMLHDPVRSPRYIETGYGRGYRFIAPVSAAPPVINRQSAVIRKQSSGPSSQLATRHGQLTTPIVGRETELARLHGWLDKALQGERQLVFVTGEPGIGKTTLINAFRQSLETTTHPQTPPLDARLRGHDVEKPSFRHSRESGNPGFRGGGGLGMNSRDWRLASFVSSAHGQCIEHYGASEAYLPVLEALGRLCRERSGNEVIALLRQHAPSWLVQMPSLLSHVELEELQRKTAGVTRERMLRELAEGLEVITAERPLVLVLEDLHWSDVSTLDLLSMLARRQERAHLLIIGTYRPVEVLTRDHPLKGIKQELQLHGQCAELALDFLSEAAVGEYLAVRFPVGTPHAAPLRSLGKLIHQRTDGNPLFMVNVTNELVARELVTQRDGQWEIQSKQIEEGIRVPENLRQLIAQQIERVSPDERKLLEAASVAGAEFSSAAVAAGIEQSVEAVETHCDTLVRRDQFLRAQGTSEWPDGTITARYGFVHALYQEVVYEQISATRRSRLHRQIGECEEQAYGERIREIAAELAVHFEQGRDYRRAIQYLQHAGANAVRRSAYQEAIILLTKGIELLNTLSDTPERVQQEFALQLALNDALIAIKGYTAPEVEKAVLRAQELCQQPEEIPQLFPVLWRFFVFSLNRGELQTARDLSERLMRLAQSVQDRYLLSVAHTCLGATLYWLGELVSARTHLEQAIALYDPQTHPRPTFNASDPRVDCLSYASHTLWLLGYPAQALKQSQAAIALAAGLSHPFSLAYALGMAAWFHVLRRDEQLARERADTVITLSTEQGFPYWSAYGTRVRGWALAEQGQVEEGIAQMLQGLAAFRAMGVETKRTANFLKLAAAYGRVGRVEEGLAVLAEALDTVDKIGEHCYEAELYRIKGELLLAQKSKSQKSKSKSQKSENPSPQPLTLSTQTEAEECFLKAIDIAQKQQAKSLELRATTSLARLWQKQGKRKQARKLLADIYGWFTEGFDTKDLQEAKALLEELP